MSQSRGWWYDDITQEYSDALLSLGIDLSSDFAQFYLHVEDGVTFHSRNHEIYQICWFVINSSYQLDLKRTHEILKIPSEYIPLDGFQSEGGYFYNKKTGEVLFINVGDTLTKFLQGELKPQWGDFNSFIEWFFDLDK
ncbi:hypothetical protein [Enterobacter cloacae]|uniref:hypothetical protein n=1 Tax=Enterobacter cloacae TaxID=550 RepID=UPI001F5C5859|nr:hypothetical protein [Enterobacter cloacae]